MRRLRRIGTAAAACVLMTGFIGGPAAADTPETYVGSAAGKALHLRLAGQAGTLGLSTASIDSTLKAVADSAGVVGLPVVGGSNAGKVEVVGNNSSESTGEKCATPALPAQLSSVLNVGVGCSSSAAQVIDGNPAAIAEGSVAKIDLDAQTVLSKVPVTGTVQQQLEGVLGELPAVLGSVGAPQELIDAVESGNATVSQVLTALGTVRTLEVRLGTSKSEVTTAAGTVTSVATSEGGTISILPLGAVGQKPVAEIIVGSANATAVYDRATGTSTPSFDPAIVTVRLNTPLTDEVGNITGIDLTEIKITPGDLLNLPTAVACAEDAKSICILKGTPFETRITVASGRTVQNPDGTVGAVADAVSIHALRNIGQLVPQLDGGVLLELAHAEAGVGGQPAVVTVQAPELPRELPRTGGFALLPMLGGTGLAAAIVSRRFFGRSAK